MLVGNCEAPTSVAAPKVGNRIRAGETGNMAKYTGYYFEDLKVGQEASISKTVTEADIVAFAEVSGDKNPVHLDADYAATTMFKERIAHGMLSAAYISAVFGMELPGPGSIYISQTLEFQSAGQDRRYGGHHGQNPRTHGKAPRQVRDRLLGRRQAGSRRRSGSDGAVAAGVRPSE